MLDVFIPVASVLSRGWWNKFPHTLTHYGTTTNILDVLVAILSKCVCIMAC